VHPEHIILLSLAGQVTDPRDRVYGLLGLLGKEIAMHIAVDVKKRVLEVYTDFTRCFLRSTKILQCLGLRTLQIALLSAYRLGLSILLYHYRVGH